MSGAHTGGVDPRSTGAHVAGAPPADLPTPSEEKAATTSLGDLVAEVTRDMSTLRVRPSSALKVSAVPWTFSTRP